MNLLFFLGEMMMSLFWYYRPEHTEQGRQDMDASDEVFASRHKDHNSVACIEDKCHVLSYSEYCRFVFRSQNKLTYFSKFFYFTLILF